MSDENNETKDNKKIELLKNFIYYLISLIKNLLNNKLIKNKKSILLSYKKILEQALEEIKNYPDNEIIINFIEGEINKLITYIKKLEKQLQAIKQKKHGR